MNWTPLIVALFFLIVGCWNLIVCKGKLGKWISIGMVIFSILGFFKQGIQIGEGYPRSNDYLEANGIYETIGSISLNQTYICLIEDKSGHRVLYYFFFAPPKVFKVVHSDTAIRFVPFPESP